MTIEVFIGDYREDENPAALTLSFIHDNISEAFDIIERDILPSIKYGMDVYIRNTNHKGLMYGYYRDLIKYPRKGREFMIKTGATGIWQWNQK